MRPRICNRGYYTSLAGTHKPSGVGEAQFDDMLTAGSHFLPRAVER